MPTSKLAPGAMVFVSRLTGKRGNALSRSYGIARCAANLGGSLLVEIIARDDGDKACVADCKPPTSVKLSNVDVFDGDERKRTAYRLLEMYLTKQVYFILKKDGPGK